MKAVCSFLLTDPHVILTTTVIKIPGCTKQNAFPLKEYTQTALTVRESIQITTRFC